jgi:hypothetical protein
MNEMDLVAFCCKVTLGMLHGIPPLIAAQVLICVYIMTVADWRTRRQVPTNIPDSRQMSATQNRNRENEEERPWCDFMITKSNRRI